MSTTTSDSVTAPVTAPVTASGIAYRVQGAADGVPVVALHGTPGSRFSGTPGPDALHALGLRVLTYDRPGYGDTPGGEARSARELAQDVLDVLDHAGVEGPVGILAGGGGTPAALAVAALHPERVAALTLVWPLAPSVADAGSPAMAAHEWGRDMDEQQRALHALALQDPVFLRDQLELGLGAHAGADGIVLDLVEVQEPWGVDPAAVRGAVDVWWGTDSAVAPAGHATWLADQMTGADVERHEMDEHQWHVRRLVEVFSVLGERLGARPPMDHELEAAQRSAAVDTDGCGSGRIGGCACGAGGCGA